MEHSITELLVGEWAILQLALSLSLEGADRAALFVCVDSSRRRRHYYEFTPCSSVRERQTPLRASHTCESVVADVARAAMLIGLLWVHVNRELPRGMSAMREEGKALRFSYLLIEEKRLNCC